MAYKKATLYYMSGTGNTFRAANWMAEEAGRLGVSAEVAGIGEGVPRAENPSAEHLTGLMMPTHGFTAPWRMIWFALRLTRGKGAHAFVAACRGSLKIGRVQVPGLEGTACYLIALILALKGYRVRGVAAFDMPANWLQVHPGLSPATARYMASRARPKAERFIRDIISGERRFGAVTLACLFLGLLLFPASLGYLFFARFFLPKIFFADNRCNGCGLCARECPFRAIRMWGVKRPRPYWTFRCESCMKCMAHCPTEAIQAGHSWGAILLYVSCLLPAIYALSVLLSPVLSAHAGSAWVSAIIHYLYFLVAVAIAYPVFALLVRIPFINALFAYTTFTRIYRRYRGPDESA
jgi:ferredoxin